MCFVTMCVYMNCTQWNTLSLANKDLGPRKTYRFFTSHAQQCTYVRGLKYVLFPPDMWNILWWLFAYLSEGRFNHQADSYLHDSPCNRDGEGLREGEDNHGSTTCSGWEGVHGLLVQLLGRNLGLHQRLLGCWEFQEHWLSHRDSFRETRTCQLAFRVVFEFEKPVWCRVLFMLFTLTSIETGDILYGNQHRWIIWFTGGGLVAVKIQCWVSSKGNINKSHYYHYYTCNNLQQRPTSNQVSEVSVRWAIVLGMWTSGVQGWTDPNVASCGLVGHDCSSLTNID